MARKIEEIYQSMISEKENTQNLNGLTSNSATAIWRLLFYICATAIALLENLFDFHKKEVDTAVNRERYGYAGWYKRMMLAFQFGDYLNDLEEQTYYNDTESENAINARIIKFAYCQEREGGAGVLIKIAKADADGKPIPLEQNELLAATAYINRIKPAGIPVTIVNENADVLTISVQVRYNPMLLTSADAVDTAVKTAINNYLNGLDYNGSFVAMKMIDEIQLVEGIEIAQISSVFVKHAGYNNQEITNLTHYIPQSGSLKLDENALVVMKEVGNGKI